MTSETRPNTDGGNRQEGTFVSKLPANWALLGRERFTEYETM
jgi:hypothetical protein